METQTFKLTVGAIRKVLKALDPDMPVMAGETYQRMEPTGSTVGQWLKQTRRLRPGRRMVFVYGEDSDGEEKDSDLIIGLHIDEDGWVGFYLDPSYCG